MGDGIFHQPTGRTYNPADMGMSKMPGPARMHVHLGPLPKKGIIIGRSVKSEEISSLIDSPPKEYEWQKLERERRERESREIRETSERIDLVLRTPPKMYYGLPKNSSEDDSPSYLPPIIPSLTLGHGSSSSDNDTPPYSGDTRSLREKWHDRLGCYLTTACIQTRGLPDDCFELTTLRKFRDDVMATRLEGRTDIEEYKRVAPEIVRRLDLIGNPSAVNQVYSRIYHATILPAVRLVQSGDFQKAYDLYKGGVLDLKTLTGVV